MMKKLIRRRIHAFLLALSMMICMFGYDCRIEASGSEEQTDETTALSVPQNVRDENGFIVWDEVEDAYGYTIQASKSGDTWEYEWYENKIEWMRFIYEHCSAGDFGDYTFKVCAFDETRTATEFSSPVTVSYHAEFSMPINVGISESNSLELTWDEVEGAARYNIRIYKNDENHSLYSTSFTHYNSFWFESYLSDAGEYWITIQAMNDNYQVSEWTEEVLVKSGASPLPTPQNIRFDESGKNIVWDEVEGADYYTVSTGLGNSTYCNQPILENWKRYISPWDPRIGEKHYIYINSWRNSDSYCPWVNPFEFEYTPIHDESIIVPQIKLENNHITWDETENAFRYLCRIITNGDILNTYMYEKDYTREYSLEGYPEGDYKFELCVIDEEGNYNCKIYPVTLETVHDERIWIPRLYHKFETVLWDYDRLRHPNTDSFWVRIRKQKDGTTVKLTQEWGEYYYGLMDLGNGDYTLDTCVREYDDNYIYQVGKWSEPMNIEKHGEGLYEKENETTATIETPPEDIHIPEDDRITSITINPAFNMKNKEDSEVELDLSKIKIKAKEIYDEEGLKRAEEALGETLNGNKHYNLLDLTLLYDGRDFSNGYDGLVKVIIPLPKGHRDKTFSCYRLTETDGKVTKETIPGEQTEDSYIIYLEHFSEYALVAAGPEEPQPPTNPPATQQPTIPPATQQPTIPPATLKPTNPPATLQPTIPPATQQPIKQISKEQKKKNEITLNKKISFKPTNNSLTVSWNKLPDADGYDIYAAPCGIDFKGITASVGKHKTSAAIRKIDAKKIDKKTAYKVKVKAYRLIEGKKQYIGTSAVMHVVGSLNQTTTNAKNINLSQKTYTLKKGKSAQIRATVIKANNKKKLLSKEHGPKLVYISSDKEIATVTATGRIKTKKRGKCIIYVRALNGIGKEINVTVN